MKLQISGNSRNNSDDILVHPDVTTYAMKNDAYTKIKKQGHSVNDEKSSLKKKLLYSYFMKVKN